MPAMVQACPASRTHLRTPLPNAPPPFLPQNLLCLQPAAGMAGASAPSAECPVSVECPDLATPYRVQNLLCMKLAAEMGVLVASPWVTWVKVRPFSSFCDVFFSLCFFCDEMSATRAGAAAHLPPAWMRVECTRAGAAAHLLSAWMRSLCRPSDQLSCRRACFSHHT